MVAPARPRSASTTAAAVVAERRAWVVLWLAFATFCALAGVGIKLASDYVSLAEINLAARVEATQGLAFVQFLSQPVPSVLAPGTQLEAGAAIEAGRPGRATIRLFDGSRLDVQPGARVALARMDVGRFTNRQTLLLDQATGAVRYGTNGEVAVEVPEGVVTLGPRSDVTVWVEAGRTRVLVYEGEARLEAGDSSLVIRPGFRGEATADGKVAGPEPRAVTLLRNGSFTRRAEDWLPHDLQSGPRDVDGQREFLEGPMIDGQSLASLRIVRQSVAGAHGETGLRQPLDLNVSGFRNLWVEAWVRVDGASLSGGGQLGSEYPMMLSLDYEGTREGSRPGWVHSFYTANTENRPVINAEPVPAGQWVRYRVNLMEQDESRRPFRLVEFAVMGQGHSYDARVADLRILGD